MAVAFILTIGVIYLPGINDVFKVTALSARELFIAIGLALVVIPVVELVKVFARMTMKQGNKA